MGAADRTGAGVIIRSSAGQINWFHEEFVSLVRVARKHHVVIQTTAIGPRPVAPIEVDWNVIAADPSDVAYSMIVRVVVSTSNQRQRSSYKKKLMFRTT